MNAKKEFLEFLKDKPVLKCARVGLCTDWKNYKWHYLKVNWLVKDYDKFLLELDFEYDDGFGSQKLFGTIWFEDGTWADRGEYDGSEWWEYHKCPEIPNELESEDTVSMEDIIQATPKGREAVMKAVQQSIQDQNEMSKKAQDTSLNKIVRTIINDSKTGVIDLLDDSGKSGLYYAIEELEAWHKAERAKLFEQIRSEVNSMYELSITDLELRQHQQGVEIPVLGKTELLEALTRLEQK